MASPNKGIAWKHFHGRTPDRHGNVTSYCNYCEKKITGSHKRHANHYNPDETCIKTCEKAPAAVLNEMSAYFAEQEILSARDSECTF